MSASDDMLALAPSSRYLHPDINQTSRPFSGFSLCTSTQTRLRPRTSRPERRSFGPPLGLGPVLVRVQSGYSTAAWCICEVYVWMHNNTDPFGLL